MTIAWSALGSSVTESGPNFSLVTKTWLASISGGYLIRVDKDATYQGKILPVGMGTDFCFSNGTVPTDVSWTLQNTQGITDGDLKIERKTYLGTPVDAVGTAIGTGVFYRVDTTFYNGTEPGVGAQVSIKWKS